MTNSRFLNCAALGFFLVVIVTVFWQIETDLAEQGIASGGPYDNAAAFPRTIAIILGVLVAIQLAIELFKTKAETQPGNEENPKPKLWQAGMMVVVFAIYVLSLTTVGYHLASAPMIFAVMWICGMRRYLKMTVVSIAIATGFAFLFEVFLNVVLPLGIWNIFIPW